MTQDDFTWQLLLRAEPSAVFCSLVRAAGQDGSVCAVEDYGASLVYTPAGQAVMTVGWMRACVSASDEGTLVTIAPTDPRVTHPAALAIQAQSVATRIRRLRAQYHQRGVVRYASTPVQRTSDPAAS